MNTNIGLGSICGEFSGLRYTALRSSVRYCLLALRATVQSASVMYKRAHCGLERVMYEACCSCSFGTRESGAERWAGLKSKAVGGACIECESLVEWVQTMLCTAPIPSTASPPASPAAVPHPYQANLHGSHSQSVSSRSKNCASDTDSSQISPVFTDCWQSRC